MLFTIMEPWKITAEELRILRIQAQAFANQFNTPTVIMYNPGGNVLLQAHPQTPISSDRRILNIYPER